MTVQAPSPAQSHTGLAQYARAWQSNAPAQGVPRLPALMRWPQAVVAGNARHQHAEPGAAGGGAVANQRAVVGAAAERDQQLLQSIAVEVDAAGVQGAAWSDSLWSEQPYGVRPTRSPKPC